ncbi:MAG: patatin-like phospholipase family protein [Deltaproteobacteria bacterium]|nr:patatin-like phospholipase family protein [Deltaproteobacteria bacterium]
MTVRVREGLVLALGGGGARGLAHIGILEVLAEHRIPVKAVVGTSIGAEIGAFLAAGMPVERMKEVATGFDWRLTLQLFFPDLSDGGLVSGKRILAWLEEQLGPVAIEQLPIPFAAIAADLESGEQVVLDRGSLTQAVRASVSLPGTLAPLRTDGRVLVDGGVVNQVPADVARRLFGGPVLAVAVHAASQSWSRPRRKANPWLERAHQLLDEAWMGKARHLREGLEAESEAPGDDLAAWSARLVLQRASLISQAELVKLRLAASPPDLLLVPDVHDIGILEFYRAEEAVEAGRAAARERLPEIEKLLAAAR